MEYGIIYSDPPWPQTKGNARACRPNQRKDLDYPVMTLERIQMTQAVILQRAAEKHNVFMWAIDKFLYECEQIMHELGYALHARMIWDKGNGIAPAFTVRFSHEYLLWFYPEGHMLRPAEAARGKYTTVFHAPQTGHSRKPHIVYDMLEDMFPDVPKLELFARNHRAGWDCWGNQTTMFDKEAIQ